MWCCCVSIQFFTHKMCLCPLRQIKSGIWLSTVCCRRHRHFFSFSFHSNALVCKEIVIIISEFRSVILPALSLVLLDGSQCDGNVNGTAKLWNYSVLHQSMQTHTHTHAHTKNDRIFRSSTHLLDNEDILRYMVKT